MALYEVIISPKAMQQLNEYVEYIQYTLLNEQAAGSVWQDAVETVTELETVAESLSLCVNKRLRDLGYRLILFRRHRYVMLYRIENKTAYIDGIYHELQDYENTFANELDI